MLLSRGTFSFLMTSPLRKASRPGKKGDEPSSSSNQDKTSLLHRTTSNMFWPEHHDATFEGEVDEEEEHLSRVLDSILKVHCTHSEPDYLIPWQKQHQSPSTSSGFVIEIPGVGKRVMTNAHSVEYGTMIQVQRRGGERKYQATIEMIANECDLALLHVDSSDFWEGLDALEFGPLPALQEEVEVLGYPTGGDSLSITSGVVSRIEMQEYSQASTHLLAIQIDAAINAGNSGGPVINDDRQVIGVAFQGLVGAENIGYVVPVTVVLHILQGLQRDGKYTGFCSLGVITASLENTGFRKSLGMLEDDLSGIMVQETSPLSMAKGIFQPNDVICQVNGIPVGNDGKIPFRRGERVSLACYIQTKFVGDTVKVTVWRKQQQIVVEVPVGISRRLVPAHYNNRPPPYMIVGGLVFTPLSVPYLYASSAWEEYVSDNVSYLLGKWHDSKQEESDEVVVLSHVLTHQENLGYDTLGDLLLEKVNGEKVRSLNHLKSLLEDCTEQFVRLEFAPNKHIMVLEHADLERVTQEVCTEHSIQKSSCLYSSGDEGVGEEQESSETGDEIEEEESVTEQAVSS